VPKDNEPKNWIEENLYICTACRGGTVTIQRVPGTTPFMIDCTKCDNNVACSTFGKVPHELVLQEYGLPTHEWVKPSRSEMRNSEPYMKEHYRLGGLKLVSLPVAKKVTK